MLVTTKQTPPRHLPHIDPQTILDVVDRVPSSHHSIQSSIMDVVQMFKSITHSLFASHLASGRLWLIISLCDAMKHHDIIITSSPFRRVLLIYEYCTLYTHDLPINERTRSFVLLSTYEDVKKKESLALHTSTSIILFFIVFSI